MDKDQLEEVQELPEEALQEVPPAPQAPPPGPPPAQPRGFPQLHRFMWGGIIVLVGTLLPFGPTLVDSMYEKEDAPEAVARETDRGDALKNMAENLGTDAPTQAERADAAAEKAAAPTSTAKHGFETFSGALFLLFGLMLIGQMRSAIAERKVALGAVLLMFFPCGWAWYKIITLSGKLDWFSAGELYKVSTFERLTLDFGSGFFLVLIGSTYVVLNFGMTFVRALTGGGSKPATQDSGRSRTRRR